MAPRQPRIKAGQNGSRDMARNAETVWEFATRNFRVALEIEPEEMDPAAAGASGAQVRQEIRGGYAA